MALIDGLLIVSVIAILILGLIAIIFYFRCYNLLVGIGETKWKNITDHYKEIKNLKDDNWLIPP